MLEGFFQALGYGLCHQLPERSLVAGGYVLPVCARDTGIYAGFALGVLALWLLARGSRPTELPRWPVLVLLGMFVLLMVFDGLTSYSGLRDTTNAIRLFTGLLTGWALAAIVVPMLNSQLWARPGRGRVLDTGAEIAMWLLMLGLSFVLLQWVLPLTGVVYPLLLSAAIIFTFVMVNLVLVCLLPFFERRYHRAREAWLPVLISLGLTGLELGLAALLRATAERLT